VGQKVHSPDHFEAGHCVFRLNASDRESAIDSVKVHWGCRQRKKKRSQFALVSMVHWGPRVLESPNEISLQIPGSAIVKGTVPRKSV
jgi:hypothetical protein